MMETNFIFHCCRSDENFYKYLIVIRDVDTKNFTRSELYAFFMNVYNAFAIKMILDHSCDKYVSLYIYIYIYIYIYTCAIHYATLDNRVLHGCP